MQQKSGYNQSTLESETMDPIHTFQLFRRIPDIKEGEAQALAGTIARIDKMATKRDFGELQASIQVLQKDMEHTAKTAGVLKLSAAVEQLQSKMEHVATKAELGKLQSKMEHVATKTELGKLQSKMEHVATKTELAEQRIAIEKLQTNMEHVATKTELAELCTAIKASETRIIRLLLWAFATSIGIFLAALLPVVMKVYS